jgi:hypothetical protein
MNIPGFWKKYIIFIIIYVILFGAVLRLAVISQILTTLENKNAINKKTAEINTLQEKITKLREANNNLADITKAYDTVNNLWPDKEEVGKFIVQSEGLASEKQIVISNITVAEAVLKNTKNTAAATEQQSSDSGTKTTTTAKTNQKESGIKFTFETESSYNRLFDFIVGMERLARFNSVSQISISNSTDNKLILRLTGYIYAK